MDWWQRLKLLIVDDTKRAEIKRQLLQATPEYRTALFEDNDDVVRAVLLGIIEPPVAAGYLTWTDWLKQDLPEFPLGFGKQPAKRQQKDGITPHQTTNWDIWSDVHQYVAHDDAERKSSRHKPIDIQDDIITRAGTSTEADCSSVYSALLKSMGRVMFPEQFTIAGLEWSRSSSMTQQATTGPLDDISTGPLDDASADIADVTQLAVDFEVVGQTDIVLKLTQRVFLVVEMKRPSFFRKSVDGEIPSLVTAYEHKDLKTSDDQRSHVLAQSIIQLFRYLVIHEIGYGIISSADLSYLVCRAGNSLRISEGIHWRHPEFIAALAYIMAEAKNDTTTYVWEEGNEDDPPQDCGDSQETEDLGGTQDSNEDFIPEKEVNLTETDVDNRSVTRSMTGSSGWKETPVAHLHLDKYAYARGWSGNIVRGRYEGHAVLVKLAPVCSDRAEALVNEASAYLKLQKYWGEHVPALISHGTTAKGTVVYIATELIKGYELGIEGLTQGVVKASFEALHAIHASGMLHGDIRRENIMVPTGGRRGVRFIDFGFARPSSSAEDSRRYIEVAQLKRIVYKFPHRTPARVASTACVIDKARNLEAGMMDNGRNLKTEAF